MTVVPPHVSGLPHVSEPPLVSEPPHVSGPARVSEPPRVCGSRPTQPLAAMPAAAGSGTPEASAVSIDELDAAIRRVTSRINAANYELLVLVREFDDRFGWGKWSFRNGTEWLAWRSGISVSAAREQLRTAHALRRLPAISAAFEQGRLSYSKVRALTRVAEPRNEDRLLAYALDATAAQVEERCRQMRNLLPESTEEARAAWERRSLTVWRHPARGTMSVTAELPVEVGELLLKALERAIEAGDAARGPEFAEVSWQTQQADALVALAQAYLSAGCGGQASDRASPADHYQVVVHVDAAALRAGAFGAVTAPVEDSAAPVEGSAGAAVAKVEASPSKAEPTTAKAETTTAKAETTAAAAAKAVAPTAHERADRVDAAASHSDTASENMPPTDTPLRGGAPGSDLPIEVMDRAPRSDLPIEVIKRLACDGGLVLVTEDGAGRPLNVGRKQRTVPTAIRRALWSRDRGCIFPGCGKTRWVHAHRPRACAQDD